MKRIGYILLLAALVASPAFAVLKMPAKQVSVSTNTCTSIPSTNLQTVLEGLFCDDLFLDYSSTGVVFNLEQTVGVPYLTWLMNGLTWTSAIMQDLDITDGYASWTDTDGFETSAVMTAFVMTNGTVTHTIAGDTLTNTYLTDFSADTNGMAWTEGGDTNWFDWSDIPSNAVASGSGNTAPFGGTVSKISLTGTSFTATDWYKADASGNYANMIDTNLTTCANFTNHIVAGDNEAFLSYDLGGLYEGWVVVRASIYVHDNGQNANYGLGLFYDHSDPSTIPESGVANNSSGKGDFYLWNSAGYSIDHEYLNTITYPFFSATHVGVATRTVNSLGTTAAGVWVRIYDFTIYAREVTE